MVIGSLESPPHIRGVLPTSIQNLSDIWFILPAVWAMEVLETATVGQAWKCHPQLLDLQRSSDGQRYSDEIRPSTAPGVNIREILRLSKGLNNSLSASIPPPKKNPKEPKTKRSFFEELGMYCKDQEGGTWPFQPSECFWTWKQWAWTALVVPPSMPPGTFVLGTSLVHQWVSAGESRFRTSPLH